MTPLQFEAAHGPAWAELEALLAPARRRGARLDAARFARLYRAACEHLAVARARGYPVGMVERLEGLTGLAHQRIYAQSDYGLARLAQLFLVGFPRAVRAHAVHVWIALACFGVPLVATGVASYLDPGFILAVHPVEQVVAYDHMYGDQAEGLGRRGAETDWAMFGVYIRNNIGIAFQCFAGGLVFGVGSILLLAYNGLSAGSVAGYLTWRGHGDNFYSFVVTHGAFELPAIVLAGAAGLALGGALLVPGRRTRLMALREAAQGAIVLVYGIAAMLLVAAALEAFWSSQRWVDPFVKYAVGGVCWAVVLGYLVWQGRPRREPPR
jgi:uncharacterized membrane protein SpoIIM required for sporulation